MQRLPFRCAPPSVCSARVLVQFDEPSAGPQHVASTPARTHAGTGAASAARTAPATRRKAATPVHQSAPLPGARPLDEVVRAVLLELPSFIFFVDFVDIF